MDWIFDHLQIVIFIAGAIAYWINQSKKGWSASEDEETRGSQPGWTQTESEPTVADNEERVRQIQEEIRRKIAERRAAAAGRGPASQPPPLVVQHQPAATVARPVAEPPPLYSNESDAESMAWQNRLAEQLAEAERAKAAAKVKLDAVWDRPSVAAAKRSAANLRPHTLSVRETLHDRKALRRAWIVREVLEKPVGLR